MIGGFLGAGKTTAVARLAAALHARGLRAGLITNDQGSGLVDTAVLRARGFATEEIPGGCFCCRFNSLVDAAGKLTAATRPDVFVAEPVGSCTDLVATVTYPLRRIYGERFTIAPLSVLLDPARAMRVFGLGGEGRAFSEKVLYIYRKQLEEADLIVINKCDSLAATDLGRLREVLGRDFPHAEVLAVSARDGTGVDAWFERLLAREQVARRAMDVDYETYADGEALLGWLNATVQLASAGEFDANAALERLARDLQVRLAGTGGEIAHLKMTFSPEGGLNDLASVNLVRSDFVPELGLRLDQPVTGGQLVLNARAETAPEALKAAVETAVANLARHFAGLQAHIDHLEHFRPGKPQPTHRDLNPV
ncbi:MAG: cobalamin biosynthesis protein P47K [Verrucomicrobia bacterium]|nr:cobalamin biosynthesis protein P47K [Verrucomicrobiota bacterium]